MRTLLFILFITCSVQGSSGTVTTVNSGNWTSSSIWSTGSIPACGDSIIIASDHSVTISSQIDLNCGTKTAIVLKGKLYFTGGSKLSMPCSSRVYIMGNGFIDSDGGGSSNRLEICSSVYWKATDGRLSGPACVPPNLPGCNQVMPVELVSFDARISSSQVELTWVTLTERNNAGYSIQRLENDQFVTIRSVNSQAPDGNSRKPLSYRLMDDRPLNGLNYYRIKQTDRDSSYSYSRIVVVQVTVHPETVMVYPNPSTGDFSVRFPAPQTGEFQVRNTAGKQVRSIIMQDEDEVRVSGLPAGIYFGFCNGTSARIMVSGN